MEVKRGQDFNNPGSQDQDPIFSNYRLPKHEVRLPLHADFNCCVTRCLNRKPLSQSK